MLEDMESELRGLRKRIRRPGGTAGGAASRKRARLCQDTYALEEELRCRSMLSPLPVPP
jgi:hypothetical protein